VTSRHCPCDRYSNYLSRPHTLILPILIIILMLASLTNTLLRSKGAAMWNWSGHSKRPSFGSSIVLFRSLVRHRCVLLQFHLCRLCDSFRSCASLFVVGWSSFNRTSSSGVALGIKLQSFGSRVTSPCRCQVQVQSVRRTSTTYVTIYLCQCDLFHGYQPWYPTCYLRC
jgi:hypothetical protein